MSNTGYQREDYYATGKWGESLSPEKTIPCPWCKKTDWAGPGRYVTWSAGTPGKAPRWPIWVHNCKHCGGETHADYDLNAFSTIQEWVPIRNSTIKRLH